MRECDKEAWRVLAARRERTSKISVEVTPEMKRRLKMLALQRGVSLTALALELFERELVREARAGGKD